MKREPSEGKKGGPTAAHDVDAMKKMVDEAFEEAGLNPDEAGPNLFDAVVILAIGYVRAWEKSGMSFDEAKAKFRDRVKNRLIELCVDMISEERLECASALIGMTRAMRAPRKDGQPRCPGCLMLLREQ